MAKASPSATWERALVVLTRTVVSVVVVACLFWAQAILVPVALAIYLTFLLSPLVNALQRYRLGRIPSVLMAVVLVALVIGGIGWAVTSQVTSLLQGLPKYTDNIKAKIETLRAASHGSAWGKIDQMVREIEGELTAKPAAGDAAQRRGESPATIPALEKPTTVEPRPETPAWVGRLPSLLTSAAEFLGACALTIVLVVFMLLKREDLRNRFIWLVGHGRLTVTTKAVDDVGQRISRFLLMQVMINGSLGLVLGTGLFLIGVEYAFLWGFLAAILRYVPYVGMWIAALPPIALSFAMFEGWMEPVLVVGLFLLIELVYSNILEPRLFGQSMGVSEVALLIAAAFWAFLWGPIGLVLSNPLTVCLMVVGKYVPQFEFFTVLLGDEPVLDADVSYYQRLLARDQDEATQLVRTHVQAKSPEAVYDDLLIPALNFAKRDRERDQLTESDQEFVLHATREILEDIGERPSAVSSEDPVESATGGVGEAAPPKVRLLGLPAHDDADRLALEMLRQLLNPAKWDMDVATVETLSAELISLAHEEQPTLICIGSLPPGGLAHTRYLCKRLRARLPNVKIVVGRWGLRGNLEQNQEELKEAGADHSGTTVLETRSHLDAWLPVLAQEPCLSSRNHIAERSKKADGSPASA